MPKRVLKDLTSPEVFGLLVRVLARYADDTPGKTGLEADVEKVLGDDSRRRGTAARLIRNFKRIPAVQRIRQLRDLAEPVTTPFPQGRLESAIAALPAGSIGPALFADDVEAVPLPPVGPFERITLNFSGIFCSEETGDQINLVGASDEIYVITSTVVVVDGQNVVRTETHPLGLKSYERVDTGNFRTGPLAACFHGKPTELSLISTVMEHDLGDPDAYRDQIDLIVTTTFSLVGILVPNPTLIKILATIKQLVVELINWLIDTDDDVVETITRVIEVDELRRMARRPPTRFVGEHKKLVSAFPLQIETVKTTTDILQHFTTDHAGGGGKYNVCFRLKLTTVGGVVGLEPVLELALPVQ